MPEKAKTSKLKLSVPEGPNKGDDVFDDEYRVTVMAIELLKRDISQISSLVTKHDTTLEKVSDVLQQLNTMVALHEEKINNNMNRGGNAHDKIDRLTGKINKLQYFVYTVTGGIATITFFIAYYKNIADLFGGG